MRPSLLHLLFLLLALSLTGCKVGPNYVSPKVDLPVTFHEDRPEETFTIDDAELVEWWTTFHDPVLNELLEEVTRNNFDFRIALERIYQARSTYWIQFTSLLPEFDADSLDTRFRTSESFASEAVSSIPSSSTVAVSPVQSFFQLALDAVWEIDFWGKFRRSADAAYDLWQASYEDMWGVKILVISETASTYTTICALQQKTLVAKQTVTLNEDLLALIKVRFESGLASAIDVETATATLEASIAELNIFEVSLKQAIYSLSVLLGELPETVMARFQTDRPIPQAEGKIPSSLPSELLRRRPDIKSAERQLASATEEIGVAVADLFPSISLAGSSSSFAANPLQGSNIGFASDHIEKLFKSASLIWGYGALITWPVFDFGKRSAAVNVQIALRNQAYYAYQKTVITALQETESALATYFIDEQRMKKLSATTEANEKILLLTQDLFQSGLADYTQVIQAKEIWLASAQNLIDSKQALATDLITLYKALGGDW